MGARYYCDGCGEEKSPADLKPFRYLCHLDAMIDGNLNVYVDNEMNPVSGREESVDLCHACYNRVMVPAVKVLRELQRESPDR